METPYTLSLVYLPLFKNYMFGKAGGVSLELPGAKKLCRLVWCLVPQVCFLVSSVCCLLESGVWWSFSEAAQAHEALQAKRRETEAWLVASGI